MKIHLKKDKNDRLHEFKNFTSINDVLSSEVTDSSNLSHLESSMTQNQNELSWWGIKKGNGNDVLKLSKYGWKEGREKAEREFSNKITIPKMPSIVRHRVWSDQGDAVDMQKVYSGQTDRAWQRARRGKLSGIKTHVLLLIDIGGNCTRNHEEFYWRGVLAALLADKLSLSGRSVKIVVGQNGNRPYRSNEAPQSSEINIVIKEFDEILNMDSLICSTALSGFFRSVGFKTILLGSNKCTGGLGSHRDYTGEGVIENHPNLARITINNIWTKESAETKAIEVAKALL